MNARSLILDALATLPAVDTLAAAVQPLIDVRDQQAAALAETTAALADREQRLSAAAAEIERLKQTPPPAPPTTRPLILWGTFHPSVPWDLTKLAPVETAAGQKVTLIHFGQAWEAGGRQTPFYPKLIDAITSRGAVALMDWGAWDSAAGITQPRYALARIAAGDHDAYIDRYAAAVATYGKPLQIRLFHELNGWWQFPWAVQANDNTPQSAIAAWRRVVDRFRAAGASNAQWVWCPNVSGPKTTPLRDLWPGAEYVDWLALDGYNNTGTWQTFAQVFAASYAEIMALAPDKPFMLGEWGSIEGGDGGAKKAAWLLDALLSIRQTMPACRAVAYFDWDSATSYQSVRLDSTPLALTAFGLGVRYGLKA